MFSHFAPSSGLIPTLGFNSPALRGHRSPSVCVSSISLLSFTCHSFPRREYSGPRPVRAAHQKVTAPIWACLGWCKVRVGAMDAGEEAKGLLLSDFVSAGSEIRGSRGCDHTLLASIQILPLP